MELNNKFNLGRIVYLRTDTEQLKRMITAIRVMPNNLLEYQLTQGTIVTYHYEIEISGEEDVLMRI